MSDINGLEITDVLGLSEPLTKLFETVACGIGKIYEPTHVRRMAKAKADEIKLISDTVSENIDLPVVYQNGTISIDASDATNLVQRAQNRFLFQQMKKQQNIESVIEYACNELENKTNVSSTPVDDNWVNVFFDAVANISDEYMQKLWGKLLAGEVEQPGRYSLRTLDTLRKLTPKEALLFQNAASFILNCSANIENDTFPDDHFIPTLQNLEQYGLYYHMIAILIDAGLFITNSKVYVGCVLHSNEIGHIYYQGQPAIEMINPTTREQIVVQQAYVLTTAGIELLHIVRRTSELPQVVNYIDDCVAFFKQATQECTINNLLSREHCHH